MASERYGPPTPSKLALVLVGTVAAATTVAAYLGWLGWHAVKHRGPDGYQTGPYTTGQVVGLVLTLGLLSILLGWRGYAVTSFVVPTALTLMWSADVASAPDTADGLWLVGAFMIAVGSFATIPPTAYAVEWMTRRPPQFNAPPGWPQAPVGWLPPDDWQPDPSWPDPPPSWDFYPQQEKEKSARSLTT